MSYVELEQTGVTEFSDTYSTQYGIEPTEVEEKIDFYAEGEKVLSDFRGANTVVTAEDKYGNRGSTTVASKRSIGGHLAGEFDWADQSDLGTFSGFTHAAAELPDFVRLLFNDPREIGEAIAEFSQEYVTVQQDPTRHESQLWMEMVRGMAADTHRTQDTDNPHRTPEDTASEAAEYCLEQYADSSRSSSDYCQFASGWYQGYSTYLVLETVVGSKGTLKGVSSTGDLRKALDDAGDVIDSGAGLRRVDTINTKTGKVTHRIVADGGSPDIDAPAVRRQLREEHGMETAGSIDHALGQLEGLRHLEDLSSSEQAALAARLSRSSDSSVARTFVTELDDVRYLLEKTNVANTTWAETYCDTKGPTTRISGFRKQRKSSSKPVQSPKRAFRLAKNCWTESKHVIPN
ncbi:hypothetical protein CP556_07285 [Natrinema sp. CBA1119]|nr:hypothetical protein CP556_07285 [Natrinema sp. CBA1119]